MKDYGDSKRKLRKIKTHTAYWERLANAAARDFVQIKPCIDCRRPLVHGYCCTFCGSAQ